MNIVDESVRKTQNNVLLNRAFVIPRNPVRSQKLQTRYRVAGREQKSPKAAAVGKL